LIFSAAAISAIDPDPLAGENSGGGLILCFEIELYLHVVGIAEENLPTGAVGHLVHAVGHALARKVLLYRLEAAAAEREIECGRGPFTNPKTFS
jgi:hypothetical protein